MGKFGAICLVVITALAMLNVSGAFTPSNGKPTCPTCPTSPTSLTSSPTSPTSLKQRKIQPLSNSATAPPLLSAPPRRIALLVEPTPFTHVSGYSNRFNEMLKYLSKANDQVSILTCDDKNAQPSTVHGYPVVTTLGFRFPLYDHVVVSIDLPECKGLRMLEQFKPDLVHLTSPGFLLFPGLLYARLLRVPVVMSYHTHLPIYAKNYLGYVPGIVDFAWFLIRFAHKRADLTLVTSPQIRAELMQHGVQRVDVWRKGIDTERFNPEFRNEGMRQRMMGPDAKPGDFLLTHVGRLGAEKRVKDIKPMLATLGPKCRLCIVGTGPQEDELKKHFEGTNTVFLGQLGGDELSQAFASGDVFVMPSDSETLGFVVLESMASGVPVVAAKAGGIQDLIRDGDTSFLCKPGDNDAYVGRIEQLMDAKFREAMGKTAREEAEKWGWEAATSVLRNIQYELAIQNFQKRNIDGYGAPRTSLFRRVFKHKLLRVLTAFKRALGLKKDDAKAN